MYCIYTYIYIVETSWNNPCFGLLHFTTHNPWTPFFLPNLRWWRGTRARSRSWPWTSVGIRTVPRNPEKNGWILKGTKKHMPCRLPFCGLVFLQSIKIYPGMKSIHIETYLVYSRYELGHGQISLSLSKKKYIYIHMYTYIHLFWDHKPNA